MLLRNLLIVLAVIVFGCEPAKKSPEPGADLAQLVEWMTGSFSSAKQAEENSNFLDIRLRMHPVWTDRGDGHWLYVEQAVATHIDEPYRQRFYHITQVNDSTFGSDVYTMDEPHRFAGLWDDKDFPSPLEPDSLALRDGCSVILVKQGDEYVGSTVGKDCSSELRGANYAASEVRISAEGIYSWDRGYDSDDVQVWGAETGGYFFSKVM